jgi:tRNA-intron endonuclease
MMVDEMMTNRENASGNSELKIKGSLVEKGVKISEKANVNELSSRGYGVAENSGLSLTLCEALYLVEKGILEVENERGGKEDFQRLLQCYEDADEEAWVKYLAYRDLRSRGYVVREGFGLGVDFRVYERGEYSKDTAKYLILSIQEGKPFSIQDLTNVLRESQSLKKELVLAVMNRRGEVVYYSVSHLTLA